MTEHGALAVATPKAVKEWRCLRRQEGTGRMAEVSLEFICSKTGFPQSASFVWFWVFSFSFLFLSSRISNVVAIGFWRCIPVCAPWQFALHHREEPWKDREQDLGMALPMVAGPSCIH